jgi:hypothetical protein
MLSLSTPCYILFMNFRGYLVAALCFAGSTLTPAVAQLIHVSVNKPEGYLLFKTDDPSIPWDHSLGNITQFDFTFNSAEKIEVGEFGGVSARDPSRNCWHIRVENAELGRSFDITKPFQEVGEFRPPWGEWLEFSYLGANHVDEAVVRLIFDSPLPTDGSLPQFPLPHLKGWESHAGLIASASLFPVPHLAEVYGGLDFSSDSITVTMTPIPESSVYGLTALALVGAAIALRRRRQCTVSN